MYELNTGRNSKDSLYYPCNFSVYFKLFQDEKCIFKKEAVIFELQILMPVLLTSAVKGDSVTVFRNKVTWDGEEPSW